MFFWKDQQKLSKLYLGWPGGEKKKREKSVKLLKSRMKEKTSLTTLEKQKEILREYYGKL